MDLKVHEASEFRAVMDHQKLTMTSKVRGFSVISVRGP